MAIDPSISLSYKPATQMDLMGAATSGMKLAQIGQSIEQSKQEIEASKQAVLLSQAQQAKVEKETPGAEALANQQIITANKMKGAVEAAKSAIVLDDSGQPIIDPATGGAKINMPLYQKLLFDSGNEDKAFSVAKNQIENVKGTQDNATASATFLTTMKNTATTAAKAAADQTKGTQEQKDAAAKSAWDKTMTIGTNAAKQSGQTLPTGADLTYEPGSQDYLYKALIDPKSQEQIKIEQNRNALGWANLTQAQKEFANTQKVGFTDAASEDASSPASKYFRSQIKEATGEDIPEDVSLSMAYRSGKFKKQLEAIGDGSGALVNAARKERDNWLTFGKALDDAKDYLATTNIAPKQFLEDYVGNKIAHTPQLDALYSRLVALPKDTVERSQNFDSMKSVTTINLHNAESNVRSAGGYNNNVKAAGTPAPKPEAPKVDSGGVPTDGISTKAGHHYSAKEIYDAAGKKGISPKAAAQWLQGQ